MLGQEEKLQNIWGPFDLLEEGGIYSSLSAEMSGNPGGLRGGLHHTLHPRVPGAEAREREHLGDL